MRVEKAGDARPGVERQRSRRYRRVAGLATTCVGRASDRLEISPEEHYFLLVRARVLANQGAPGVAPLRGRLADERRRKAIAQVLQGPCVLRRTPRSLEHGGGDASRVGVQRRVV